MLSRAIALALLSMVGASVAIAQERSVVRFTTEAGVFDVRLADESTPLTVANFLAYVNANAYDGSFFHRSVTNFVVQGGGFREQNNENVRIPTNAPVQNEPLFTNTRGTIAMAKLGGDPNSATNQWFFNLGDNSATLDEGRSVNSNGGFTVFGIVIDNGMAVVDAIAALPIAPYTFTNGGSAFGTTPLDDGYASGQTEPPVPGNLVVLESVRVVTSLPVVQGFEEAAAREALTTAGFTVGTVSGSDLPEAASCAGVDVAGAFNNRAVPGSTVPLRVVARSPALENLGEAEARAALTAAGLRVGEVTGSAAGATVRAQSVAAGAIVDCASAVDLTLLVPAKFDPSILQPLLDLLLEED